MKNRQAVFDLFLASALGLFVELMMVRWVATEVRIFSFYKNFALIAAFLGLGIGFALRRRDDSDQFGRLYFPLLTIVTLLVLILGRTPLNFVTLLNNPESSEFVWAHFARPDRQIVSALLFYTAMLTTVTLLTMMFIPLGHLTATAFSAFEPLPGYTINIIGSLVGILAFTIGSWLGLPPPVWYLVAGAAGMYFLLRSGRRRLVAGVVLVIIQLALTQFWPTGSQRTVWSSYYSIGINKWDLDGVELGYKLKANQLWHQNIWNLSPQFVEENRAVDPEHFDSLLTDYDLPFESASSLDNVLIVGAGAGNDVAAALRADAQDIVAVEIDPVFFRLGEDLHPEHPYGDPRVEQIAQDARSYFRRADETFDLIVFGRVDSQTLSSLASSIRLDNFVYTVESLREVRDLLSDDGLLTLSFLVGADFIGQHHYRTITEAFGHPPQVYELPTGHTIFLIKRTPVDEPLVSAPLAVQTDIYSAAQGIRPITDNWPYLYLIKPTIPMPYIIGLLGIALVSFILIRGMLPDFRRVDGHFFFMGTAFFLLETKSITELALLLGSTWVVNAAVIAAILAMIVLANALVERFRLTQVRVFYGLLAAALVFNFFVPMGNFLGLPLVWRIVFASLAQALPLFFAGIIFAITFSQTDSIEGALGSNLFGAVLGGLTEYSSLLLGIRSLYIFALVFYAISAVAFFRRNRG